VGHPLTDMLQQEMTSLETALSARGYNDPHLMTQILQHETFTLLARGTTQPITDPMRSPPRSQRRRSGALDPGVSVVPPRTPPYEEEDPVAPAHFTSYMSPMASSRTRDVATNLRRLTTQTSLNPSITTPAMRTRFPPF
jgi:hypothetical protein